MKMHTARAALNAALLAILLLSASLVNAPLQSAQAATLTVNTTADELNNDGDCSLREALQAANTNAAVDACGGGAAGADTITFGVAGTITLSLGQLVISEDLTLSGPGASLLTVNGNSASRVFYVNSGVAATISGLTIYGGRAPQGAAGAFPGGQGGDGEDGGGIYNAGDLTVVACYFAGNQGGNGGRGGDTSDPVAGNGGAGGDGGAIYNAAGATLAVKDSTLYQNTSGMGGNGGGAFGMGGFGGMGGQGGNGGAIYNAGMLILSQVTVNSNQTSSGGQGGAPNGFSGNQGLGGGLYNWAGTATITSATFAANNARDGAIDNASGTLTLINSIVAQGGPANCNGTITNGDHNLQYGGAVSNSCGAGIPTADPLLASLANNGGPTQTQALTTGSAAIDQIANGVSGCVSGTSTDQRGAVRADGANRGGAACDIGAYEYDSSQKPTAVTLRSLSAAGGSAGAPAGMWAAVLAGLGGLGLSAFLARRRALRNVP